LFYVIKKRVHALYERVGERVTREGSNAQNRMASSDSSANLNAGGLINFYIFLNYENSGYIRKTS